MVDFAVEPLSSARPDIETMVPRHWEQFGDRGVAYNLDWNLYGALAARGAMLTVMAREFEVPVGYLWAFIYANPNAQDSKVASIPTYFVEQRPARALIMSRMVDFALEKLAGMGVYKVNIDTNAEHSAGRLWELKGFKVSRIGYSLQLEKPAGALHA